MTQRSAPTFACRTAAGRWPAAAILLPLLASATGSVRAQPAPELPTAPTAATAPNVPIIILIGGNHSDPSPEQLAGTAGRTGNSGLYRLMQDLRDKGGLQAEYFNWNGTRGGHIDDPQPPGAERIALRVRELRARRPQAPVILVGNSWGGHTAWQVAHLLAGGTIHEKLGTQQSINGGVPQPPPPVAESLDDAGGSAGEEGLSHNDPPGEGVIPVDLLMLLDASSFGRGTQPMPRMLPANVRRAVNYHTHNSFCWCGWLTDERLENIDLGDPQHGYLAADGPRYDSPLSWAAHVSAEWDERIHAAMRQKIAKVVPPTLSVIEPAGEAP